MLTKAQVKALQMNRLNLKIIEESSEVIHATAKLLQHGRNAVGVDHGVEKEYDNLMLVLTEYEQLQGFIMELCDRNGLTYGMVMAQLRAQRG